VVLTALEDMPVTVAKGRARVEQELRNAEIIGRFAVGVGWRQAKGQLEWLAGQRQAATDAVTATERSPGSLPNAAPGGRSREMRQPSPRPSAHRTERSAGTPPHAEVPHTAEPHAVAPSRDPEVDRVIPDYDILAASQVVRRLDGLDPEELRAVVRHEQETRRRRTILQRAEELLGGEEAGTDKAPDKASTEAATDGSPRPSDASSGRSPGRSPSRSPGRSPSRSAGRSPSRSPSRSSDRP
jgi:hypothetical protein